MRSAACMWASRICTTARRSRRWKRRSTACAWTAPLRRITRRTRRSKGVFGAGRQSGIVYGDARHGLCAGSARAGRRHAVPARRFRGRRAERVDLRKERPERLLRGAARLGLSRGGPHTVRQIKAKSGDAPGISALSHFFLKIFLKSGLLGFAGFFGFRDCSITCALSGRPVAPLV